MDSARAVRQCLEELDVQAIRSLWHLIAPNAPQPENDRDALIALHMARTKTKTLTPRQRYYSHRWLLNHNQLSMLPDEEKPPAERMYPQVVSSVGISVGSGSDLITPAIPIILGAMENAVHEAYADGRRDDIPFLKQRMNEARATAVRKLFGR